MHLNLILAANKIRMHVFLKIFYVCLPMYCDAVINEQVVFVKCLFFPVAETHCVKFYHPERRNGEIMRLCRNDECVCAEGKQSQNAMFCF